MRSSIVLCAAMLCVGTAVVHAAEPEKVATAKFELKDGDRVVFLGNTLIEREQKYGHWELMLTMAWPDRNVTFRNLGWSGDTVEGESRAGFGRPADGFKALVDQVNAAKPTVIFVGYGNVEAFGGEKELPNFIVRFNKLLDVLEATKARILVLGPIPQNPSVSKSSGVSAYNLEVERYGKAIQTESQRRGHRYVDLIQPYRTIVSSLKEEPSHKLLTADGMALNGLGYSRLFRLGIGPQLGLSSSIAFDDDPYHFSTFEYAAKLPELIQKKNELFFYRWRPQNETYLFGFRKHEQGKNAVEVFQYDPLIEAEEKKIAELRVKLAAELKVRAEKKEQGAK
ncbi:MAG: hypothetical protein K8U03_12815 [Planctomycetia bacterium]|nr:hypothetical protein [Planctomycetia bacterium]